MCGGGVKPPKEDEDPDDDDKDSEDKDPDDKETEDGDKIPGEGNEKDDKTPGEGDEKGDDTPGEGDESGGGTPGEGGNDGGTPTDGESSGDTPAGDGTGVNGDGNGSEEAPAEEDNGDTRSTDGGNGAASEENGGGNTETMSTDGGAGTDDTAPASSDSASGKESAGFSIETGSFAMPAYASENPQDGVKAGTLTDSTDAAPADDTAAQTDTDMREKTVIIGDITWESDPAYDGDTGGVYTFTPVLPEGYALSDGVSLPQITVTVAEDDTQAEELRVLMELLRALPDPEEYLTYDEAADAVTEHEDMIDEEQLEEAREAADAYLDRYPVAETADSADTDDADTDSVSLAALLARLEGLEHIRDTVTDCMDTDCPCHYPQFVQERMAQDETPELLTLEDLVEDYGVEAPVTPAVQTYGGRARAAAYAAPVLHPKTLMVTADNEDNAHTGTADGDIDETMSAGSSSHPIEISFTLDELPTQSAYLAVKAYDVDEEFGEHDYVYLNGDIYKSMDLKDSSGKAYNSETVGYLSGTNATWNTTVLEIPLKKLVKGKNVISVTVASGWVVEVDWMQLVLDGGGADPNIEMFALKITDAVTEGGNVTVHSDVTIRQKGTIQYATEYTLTQEATGDALDACFGSASATETVGLTMPLDSPTGTYRITGILKNPDTEEIKAVDNIPFYFTQGVGMGAKTTHTLTPDTLTNQSVTIRVSAEATEGVTNVTVTPNTRTVTANGTYNFTVEYRMNGTRYSYNYPVKVDNIDKEPPFIGFSAITVTEGMTQEQMKQAFEESLTVTDNVTKDCTVTYTLPKVADVRASGGGKVTVTAQDEVGNKATLDCVLLVTSPFAFSKPTAVRQGTTRTFTLTAKLTAIGRKAVTESGFVWGIMPNPSLTYNQGSAKTASPVTKAGVNFSVKTTEIVEGMTYYARAYAKVGDICYYSDPVPFSLDAKQCGTFTIAYAHGNSVGATFTVTRTGGTEGAQTVYFRTVNGTAVGGTHFVHQASSVTFKDGETEKDIAVRQNPVTSTYGGRTATAYSNADRTYSVEIYRVTGGGTLGSTTRATRNMGRHYDYSIDRSLYEPKSGNAKTDAAWDNRGSCHQYEITDGGSDETNGTNYGINWYNGRTNHKGHKVKPFNLPRYHRDMPGTGREKAYFLDSKNPSDGWGYRYEMTETQIENGWGHLWVGTAPAPTGKQTVSDKNGASPFNGGSQKWAGFFETGYSAGSTIHVPGTPSDHGKEIWASRENGSIYTYGGQKYIMFGAGETAYMHFAANGPKNDVWRIDSITDYRLLIDTKEPQLLGVAPMAGGAYKQGDEVTISLVFDEIVDSANSNKAGGLGGLVAKTNWGDFSYVGGADTNVLIFKGTVPANASGKITVNSITNAGRIKDICDHAGGTVSAGTGSTSVTVDTKQPTVAITNTSLANGTASAKITATNEDTLQYAWSQDTTMPAAGWFTCKNGETVTTRQASGKWYLHALATYEGTGASAYQCSSAFDFGTPESPKFPLPELSVTAVNSSWTNQNRTITITKKPAGASLEVTKPDGTTQTLSNNATTYAAPENGVYTFVLTSNGETVAKDAVVEKIDKVKPDATLTEAGGTDAIYHKLTMTAKAADADSGVKSVEYAFTASSTAPSSGWTTAADSDKLADGRYKLEYTATENVQTTKYLHVRVTDNAGNTFTVRSQGYKVVREPADSDKPAITLTASPSGANWTKGDVTLTWTVTKGGAENCTVHVGDEMLTGQTTGSTGDFTAQKNGIYMVSLTDKNGDSASASVVVNNIDREAPTLEKLTVAPAGYAAAKTVTLTGVNDTLTTQYNDKGVTGKDGSGIGKREYKLAGASDWTTFTGDRFTVDKAGTYAVRLTDNAGNVSKEYTIDVASIDTTAPKLTVTVNATPNANSTDGKWYTDSTIPVTLTYKDEAGAEGPASGVKSVQYAFVYPATPSDAPVVPASLTSLGSQTVAAGSATCNLTQDGIWYLYCKVTDKAGNVNEGWINADGELAASASQDAHIKKDSNKGSVTIRGKSSVSAAATTGVDMSFTIHYGPSGGQMLATGSGKNPIEMPALSTPGQRGVELNYYGFKTTGTNQFYYKPNSWGTKYYWTFYVRKVTFDSQGGSAVEPHLVWTTQSSASTSTKVDCRLTEPAEPTRTGYDFIGWYTDAACTKEFDFANQTQIRTDMTLYAKWEAIKYNVTYTLKVPQTVTESSDEYSEADYTAPADKATYTYGQKMELPVPTLASGVKGFTFDGWYTKADYTGTRYTSIPETAAKDMEYYARYLDTQAPPEGHGQVGADRNTIGSEHYYRDISTFYVSYSYGPAYKTENENRQIENFEVWRDGVSLGTKENTSKNKRVSAFYLQGRPNTSVSPANYIIEGDHTYQVQATDTAGNKSVVHSERVFYDKIAPKGPEDVGDITYSTDYVKWYTNGSSIKNTPVSGYQEIKVFSEVPTISIPVQDKPGDGANASSGLWKVVYKLRTLDKATGNTDTYANKEIMLTDQGTDGVAKITLPDEDKYKNWRGEITEIFVYDKAGNYTRIDDIGEVLVDTTAPYISDTFGTIFLRTDRGGGKKIEDKWYLTSELDRTGGDDRFSHIMANTGDLCGIWSYRLLVNGKELIKEDLSNIKTFVQPKHYIYESGAYKYPGANTFTLEVTDYAGHTTTASVTLKIGGDPGNPVAEQTPAAVCDYPADAVAQLAPNARYAITVPAGSGGTTYTVTTDAQGRIPFVLNAGVAAELSGNATVDLCGQDISIVKKGVKEVVEGAEVVRSKDSAEKRLAITARPDAAAVNSATVEAELLKEAGDAKISLTLGGGSGTQKTWEYKVPGSETWTTAPADDSGNVTITNLPKGDITLRVKAQANSAADQNDGWPHGEPGTKNIDSKAGTITAKFDLNTAGGATVSEQPADQTSLNYKSTLTKPDDPTRTDYEFMGWYQTASDYQQGGSTDKAWRFDTQTVGEILGTNRSQYESKLNNGVFEVTLYAGWRENVAPTVTPALKTKTGADGSGQAEAAGEDRFYPNLFIDLSCGDNMNVTKLSVKKDTGAYQDVALTEDGVTGDGTASSPYKLSYPVEEGVHTYTFKAQDAAGNETEPPVTVTAKLDTVRPVFGEAEFEEGYKHLWDWIIKQKSLTITIPVTETGSGIASNGVTYTLTPAGGGTATTGNATVSGNEKAGYTATITISKTFKGIVEINAADKAGNKAVSMKIGKKTGEEGNGIDGIIVESAAPVVTVLADRETGDTTATATAAADGKAVETVAYYNSAPRLFVTVTDEDLDGGQTAAGLASISWRVSDSTGSGTENPVGADYLGAANNAPLTSHSFTIGGLEGRTGAVTVTIKATDQAGNETTYQVTLHIKDKMPLPAPTIDYIDEKLTGLTAGTTYDIGGEEVKADADGSIAIREEWFGSDLSLHAKTNKADTTLDSDDVKLTPAARPDAPAITKTDETIKKKGDGKLHQLDDTMEYSTDDGKTWTAVQTTDAAQAGYATTDGVMENLAAGVFLVRVKAKANTAAGANDGAPHGRNILAQIEEGTPLTVTFDTNGGSDLAPVTGLAWNDTVERPKDPAKDGYAVEGWYRDEALNSNSRWNFKGETAAHALNNTNGVKTDGDAPGITLYAKWKDDESPTLDAQLTAGTERAAADERSWYNSLAVVLTYSDNEAVTELYVKKDGETDFTEITGVLGTENGKDEAGNTRYQYTYENIAEGEHTYTFKAADAMGKENETTVTARLDTTKPEFGTASYEEGHKNLWDWIIRKDSLLITVPVTETQSGVDTVEYTLIPAGNAAAGAAEGDADGGTDSASDIITGTAKVTGSQSEGYQAKIGIAPDFKGSVKLTGSDRAGNVADEKTIGTDGNGANGVIVENNAPQITILADRLPSEPETTRPEGTTLLLGEGDYYDNAPGLVVQLTDDGMGYGVTGESVTGDGSLTTSGLASMKYQAGTNPEKTVEKDYHTAIVTQDSFTIPDAETMAPAGATSITVTVKATDQAGNTATRTVTVRLKSREATPQAGIGYVAEKLTGLKPNTVYIINDMNLETDAAGTVAINESWFDTAVEIVMPGNRSTTVNSTAQELTVPARPAAAVLGAANASYPGAADGAITLTAPAQGAAYEISADGGKTWKDAAVSDGKITGLAAGDYRVRVKAVEGKNFCSTPTEVKVEATPATPYDMPDAEIEYRLEVLKGFEPGAVYELTTYGSMIVEDDEESGEDGGGSEGGGAGDGGGSAEDGTEDEEVPDPTVLTLTAGADGTIPIKEEWLGNGFYIVRKGNDKDKTVSPAQTLNIPLRPDAPTPTGEDVSPANPAELAKLKDLAPNTAYDVSADGGKTWETRTTDGNGVIRGLDAPETYVARVSATDTNFKGKVSGEVELGSFQLTVTFMANGEKHQEVKVYYGKKLTPVPAVPPKKDAGDQILAGEWCRDEDGNHPVDFYTEKITADLTVYACYSEGRLVTLKTGKGYTLTPQEGSGSLTEQGNGSYSVKVGGSFTFKFALAEGYEKTGKFAVKVNGAAVGLAADGTCTITNITENQTVTVEGVKKTGGNNGGGSSGGSHGGDDNGGNNGGGDSGGNNGGGDNGGNNSGGTTPGGTKPGDNTRPGSGTKPGDNTKLGSGTKPGDNTKPGDGTKPGSNTKPGDSTKPGNGTKPGDSTKPGDNTKPGNGSNPSIGGEVPKIPVTIKDGKIVIGGTGANGTDGGNGTGADGTDGAYGGGIATGNVPGMTGAGTASQNGESTMSTVLQLGDGAIIVTVVCKGEHYTAGVTDTVAVANAALTPEQIQLAAGGETIEIRVEVTDISESVPTQDKGVIENAIGAYHEELSGLTLGMYIDISVFIRVGGGDWNAIRKTGEPIDVIIGIPEELQSKGSAFYIIRAHDGECTLLEDTDAAEDTITIRSDLFSSYAIAYIETDGTGADAKCGLCHICPTFLGICYFIWLAVILAVVVIVILVIVRRRKREEEQEGQNG